LAVAPTKSIDRTEWLAEKATEIGFDRLTLLDCVFSERRVVNLERMERILLSGVKQSHKLNIPQLDGITKFSEFIRQPFAGRKFIAHCYEQADLNPDGRPFLLDALKGSQEDTLVMVGPEGDFSVDEVRAALDAGYTPISLGESRLRTETAALVAVHLMNINNRKKHVCRN
jgi:16S rRNA (uracil1498-N3)-methyltransferase